MKQGAEKALRWIYCEKKGKLVGFYYDLTMWCSAKMKDSKCDYLRTIKAQPRESCKKDIAQWSQEESADLAVEIYQGTRAFLLQDSDRLCLLGLGFKRPQCPWPQTSAGLLILYSLCGQIQYNCYQLTGPGPRLTGWTPHLTTSKMILPLSGS